MNQENFFTKKCVICNDTFQTLNERGQTCSLGCMNRLFTGNSNLIKCLKCKKPFAPLRITIKTCDSCKSLRRKIKSWKISCRNCEETFEITRPGVVYCSDKCKHKYLRKKKEG